MIAGGGCAERPPTSVRGLVRAGGAEPIHQPIHLLPRVSPDAWPRAPLPEDRAGQILVLHETGENVIYTPARAADAPIASEALPHHERLRPAPHVGFGRAESRGQAREAVGVWQLTLDCGCDPLDQVDHVDVQLRGACAL
jgi:hypothetical protein